MDMVLKPMSEKERLDRFDQMADKALEDHVILASCDVPGFEGWTVGQPGSSAYWATIIITRDHSVIVHGDVDVVCFQRCSGATDKTQILRWAGSPDASYLTSKAAIGTGHEAAYGYDPARALYDAMGMAHDCPDEPVWGDIVDMLLDGHSQHEIMEFMHEHGVDDPPQLGVGPSPRVLWARALCRKTSDLLDA